MNSERTKWKTLTGIKTGPPLNTSQPEFAGEMAEPTESKKPRTLTKALRSLSSSSLESIAGSNPRNSSSYRRLQKTPSNSSSMIERLHRRVSRDSGVAPFPSDYPENPLKASYDAMDLVCYGHLKVDTTLLKARSEYLVLAERCLVKFGSVEAARTVFPQLSQPEGQPNSVGSAATTTTKSTAADIRLEIPLLSIVAVFNEEGSSPRFGIEVWWFAPRPRLAYCKTHLFFALPQERDDWLANIQRAYRARIRKAPPTSVIPENLRTRINRIVDNTESTFTDGGVQNLTFPVARRMVGTPQKPNAAEEPQYLTDSSSFYLVIGPCMCYFIEVLKADHGTLPGDLRIKVMYFGTVTLTRFRASVASHEQRFVMSFRFPFGRETRLDLASTHYRRIIESLTKVDRILKPMWPQHYQQVIFEIKGLPPPLQLTSGNDLGGIERSLQAYGAAFSVQVPRWTIEWSTPPQPAFRLLPPDGAAYSSLQLIAVFRALRFNGFFKALSFRDVDLSSLAGKKDHAKYGDCVVHTSLNGLEIPDEYYDLLLQAPVLTQEMHALVFASESIRSLDLTNVLGFRSRMSRQPRSVDYGSYCKTSSEILRPVLMLMRRQLGLCNSISMSNNPLSPGEVDDLANLVVLDHVSFKKLELSNCSLGDAGLSKLWTGLAGQATSLEHLDTSDNRGTVKFDTIQDTLSQLRAITKLNISGNTRLDGNSSLFDAAAINNWALRELDVSGIALNDATVDVMSNYLQTATSKSLQVINMSNCGLNARQIARMFRDMGQARRLTFHLNANRLDDGIDDLCGAIACGYGPWGLFMQMIEFAQEANYIKLLRALTVNKTIECLSLAGSATPDAASNSACQAVSDFFAKNDTIRFLDISGYDAKLDEGRLGREFSRALSGIRMNSRIEHLRVRNQMLNINIGDLAEAISGNKTIHSIDCEANDFNLSNFRHLVKHLDDNTTIRYFSAFSEEELSRAIQKSVDNAGTTVPMRRSSVIARFRHERAVPSVDQSLAQQLKDEWDAATGSLERILQRNQKSYEEANQREGEDSSHSSSKDQEEENMFSAAFGGLALREREARKAKGRRNSERSPQRRIALSQSTSLSDGHSAPADPASLVLRSSSTVSSEVPVSPTTDGGSSGSMIATPPEAESPAEKDFSLGASKSNSPDIMYSDLPESNYTFDTDGGLQMKGHRRFWSDSGDERIEEEDSGNIADKEVV